MNDGHDHLVAGPQVGEDRRHLERRGARRRDQRARRDRGAPRATAAQRAREHAVARELPARERLVDVRVLASDQPRPVERDRLHASSHRSRGGAADPSLAMHGQIAPCRRAAGGRAEHRDPAVPRRGRARADLRALRAGPRRRRGRRRARARRRRRPRSRRRRARSSSPRATRIPSTVVRLARNFGQHPAVFAGLAHARGDASPRSTATSSTRPRRSRRCCASCRTSYPVVSGYRENRRDPFAAALDHAAR